MAWSMIWCWRVSAGWTDCWIEGSFTISDSFYAFSCTFYSLTYSFLLSFGSSISFSEAFMSSLVSSSSFGFKYSNYDSIFSISLSYFSTAPYSTTRMRSQWSLNTSICYFSCAVKNYISCSLVSYSLLYVSLSSSSEDEKKFSFIKSSECWLICNIVLRRSDLVIFSASSTLIYVF